MTVFATAIQPDDRPANRMPKWSRWAAGGRAGVGQAVADLAPDQLRAHTFIDGTVCPLAGPALKLHRAPASDVDRQPPVEDRLVTLTGPGGCGKTRLGAGGCPLRCGTTP